MLPFALTLTKVRKVESVSQDKQVDVIPKQHQFASWNGGYVHALGHTCSTKADIVGNSPQPLPSKLQIWELLKQEFGGVPSNSELSAGWPLTGSPIHSIELVLGATPRLAPRLRRHP